MTDGSASRRPSRRRRATSTSAPADTYLGISGIVPTLDHLGHGSNSLTLDYGTYHDTHRASRDDRPPVHRDRRATPRSPTASILTNELHESEGSTNNGGATNDAIVQVKLTEPVLTITKGVVSTDDANGSLLQAPSAPSTFSAPGTSGYPRIGDHHLRRPGLPSDQRERPQGGRGTTS